MAHLGRQRFLYVSDPLLVEEAFVRHADHLGKWGRINRWWRQGPQPFRETTVWLSAHKKEHYLPARRALQARYARSRVPHERATLAAIGERCLEDVDGQIVDLFAVAEDVLTATGAFHLFGLTLSLEETHELAGIYRQSAVHPGGTFSSSLRQSIREKVLERASRQRHAQANDVFHAALVDLLHRGDASDPLSIPGLFAAGVVGEEVAGGLPGPTAPLAQVMLMLAKDEPTRWLLADEADKALSAEELTPAYSATVREAVRLGATWRVNRIVHEPFALGDLSLRRGDVLIASPRLLHHDPRFWESPERFNLAHWEPEAERSRPARAFIPFGFPSRICVARHMAYAQLAALAALLARDWRVEVFDKGVSWQGREDGETIPRGPIRGRLSRRDG